MFYNKSKQQQPENTTLDFFIEKSKKYCAFQERSLFQIKRKLIEWGANSNMSLKVIEYLEDNNFINDERFAEMLVNGKLKYNKWGRIKIEFLLKEHHIPSTIIKKCLSSIDDTLYKTVLNDVMSKKYNELKNENNTAIKPQKIIKYCLSKGFEMDYIYSAIKNLN